MVDASSSQSRADVVVILLSAVLTLTGLQWLSLRPVEKEPVSLLHKQGKGLLRLALVGFWNAAPEAVHGDLAG